MKMFGRTLSKMLMAKADGAGGAGAGGDEHADDDAEEEKKWNERFHKASTGREKRFKAELLKEMTATFETSFGSKFEDLKKLLSETEAPKSKDGEENAKGGKLNAEADAMIRQAQKDAKEAKDSALKWEKEATAEKQRASKNEERQALMTQLNGKVKPALLDMVVDQLHAKHLTRDAESGTILWKDDDGSTLPLKDAVAAWAKSDVGKEFTPPKSVHGTGSRGASPEENASRIPGTMNAETLGSIVLGSIPGQR